jgi:hypothetical protein
VTCYGPTRTHWRDGTGGTTILYHLLKDLNYYRWSLYLFSGLIRAGTELLDDGHRAAATAGPSAAVHA